MKQLKTSRMLLLLPLLMALAGCMSGPDYVRPGMDTPAIFKEMQGWRPAKPVALSMNGKWWEMFSDAQLDRLVEQIDISNQNLAIAEANFRKAVALVRSTRAAAYPTMTLNVSKLRSTTAGNAALKDSTTLSLDAGWEIDVWGRVRRNVESSEASAQATAADLAAARLSAQAQLAQNYLQLRVTDARQQLLDDTVSAYQRSYQMTQNQYAVGVAARSDVIQAQAQLKSAQAQALDNGVQRAQLEHAIALLAGQPASGFSIQPSPLTATAPPVPLALPSTLLE
ncbi:MAG: efflux transporter outer membrane subunit, partial [Herbaspirillum sp.]